MSSHPTPIARRGQIIAWAIAAILAAACRTATPSSPAPPAPAPSTPAPSAPEPAPAATDTAAETAQPEVDGLENTVFKNTIRWVTASEVDSFGFDVYRGESETGPFVRLNAEIIEGAGTTDEPRRYEFVDSTIDPYKTYYYYVESIAMSGEREHFTPIAKVAPKIPEKTED